MSKWNFDKESNDNRSPGNQPYYNADVPTSKKNVIATSKGWVRREHGTGGRAGRVSEEVIVAANPGNNLDYTANTFLSNPDIGMIYFDDTITANSSANAYVVFNEPLVFNGGASAANLEMTVANTVGGAQVTATCVAGVANTIINANNTLVFSFTPTEGTYKVEAQTISVVGGGAVPLYNPEEGTAPVANLVITATVSNTAGEFEAS